MSAKNNQLRYLIFGLGSKINNSSFEEFYQRQYQDYLLTNSDFVINGKRLTVAKRKKIIAGYIVNKYQEDRPLTIVGQNDVLATTGVPLTEDTFIDRLLSKFPKDFTQFDNIKLVEKVKLYQLFLQSKLALLKGKIPEDATQIRRSVKLIEDNIVKGLHKEFNNTNLIWMGNVALEDLITCFDAANIPTITLTYQIERRMVIILKEIQAVNNEIALKNFNIKDYRQKKSQSEKRTPTDENTMVYKINNIFNR